MSRIKVYNFRQSTILVLVSHSNPSIFDVKLIILPTMIFEVKKFPSNGMNSRGKRVWLVKSLSFDGQLDRKSKVDDFPSNYNICHDFSTIWRNVN